MIDAPLEAPFQRARANRTSLFVNDVDVGSGERAPMLCNLQFAPLQGSDDAMIVMISPREIASRINQNHSSGKAAKSAIGMAEMLAHEIKNPLAGITGAAQLLSMGLSVEDQEMTDLIVEESRRIVKLLEQVEQFGNLSPPDRKPVNIHDVLDRARRSALLGFGAHMKIIEDYDPSLPMAVGDPDQLLQVVLNLLTNAFHAVDERKQKGPEGYEPTVRVKTRKKKNGVEITVEDNGGGIPENIREKIFQPFFTTKPTGEGTGLGLSMSYDIVTKGHGGSLEVSSREGKGTTFLVGLPES